MFHLIVFLLLSSSRQEVSGCDPSCTDRPEFSASSLLVEVGGAANVSCRLCRHACLNRTHSGLEAPQGDTVTNGTTVLWSVEKFTQSKTNLLCFYTVGHTRPRQCCNSLPVVSYQPPQNVSFSAQSGPVMEDQLMTLQCDVRDVVFVGSLNLTLYREEESLHGSSHRIDVRKSSDWNVSFPFNVSREDQGARFWCEAQLSLEVGTDRHSRVFRSNVVTAEVYYKPRLKGPPGSSTMDLSAGERLQLNCSADGNPAPDYRWTHPSSPRPLTHDQVLTLESVASGDEGEYICSASNAAGESSYRVVVVVRGDIKYIIIIAVVLSVVILVGVPAALVYARYYSLNRTGQYSIGEVFHLSRHH